MPAVAGYAHIELNQEGTPVIAGTRTKVVMIAVDHNAQGWDANRIRQEYPYLSLGQIYSALAYYYDHKDDIDRAIAESDRRFEELRAARSAQVDNRR
jgi:uncharacterized protein (DUF433 family)